MTLINPIFSEWNWGGLELTVPMTYKYDQKLCDQPNYLLEGSLVAKFLNGIVY